LIEEGYPVISYGVRKDSSNFNQCMGNVLRIELAVEPDYPATKTIATISRSLYHTDNSELDIPVRTKWSKCTEQIIEGLKTLQIDNEGLLSIPDKPLTPAVDLI
jgi:hypothetical protein